MKINCNYFDGRYTQCFSTEVVKVGDYKGHDIFKDADGWHYVLCHDNWQYFASLREAKRFINQTMWN